MGRMFVRRSSSRRLHHRRPKNLFLHVLLTTKFSCLISFKIFFQLLKFVSVINYFVRNCNLNCLCSLKIIKQVY